MEVGQPGNMSFRPKSGASAPYYAPHRDVAYIYRSICAHAFKGLEEANWEDWYGDYLRNAKITEEELGEGCRLLAEAHNHFTGDASIETANQALERVGFYDLPYPVIITIFARLGMVLVGTFFMGLRDVTMAGADPNEHCGVEEIVQHGREIAERLTKPSK